MRSAGESRSSTTASASCTWSSSVIRSAGSAASSGGSEMTPFGQRAERQRLVAKVRGADSIETESPHDHREPALDVFELVEVDAREPAERLLHDVFCFGGVAERAPGESEHPVAILTPDLVEARVDACWRWRGGRFVIHGSSAPRPTVVSPITTRRRAGT